MVYADFTFYEQDYFGEKVPRRQFARMAARASRWLDMLTFGRIDGVYAGCVDVRMACCAMADVLYDAQERRIARERLDAYEVAYERGEDGEGTLAARLLEAARVYLWRTGLLSLAVAYA